MKKLVPIVICLAALPGIFSCSKDKSEPVETPTLNYVKHWAANAEDGELKGYSLNVDVQANGVGSFNYALPSSAYTSTPISWKGLPKDSIQMDFTCNDFPEYRFEFHGKANPGLNYTDGYYIRIRKTNANERTYRGIMTFD